MMAAMFLAALLQAGLTPGQPVRTIGKGMDSAVESAQQVIARTPEEWAKLWHAHSWDRPLPAVDFSREMVAGVFMGTRPTAGFSIEIVGTRQEHGGLVVQYRETRPGRDAITAQVITSPYHLAAIPRFAGAVTFQHVETQ